MVWMYFTFLNRNNFFQTPLLLWLWSLEILAYAVGKCLYPWICSFGREFWRAYWLPYAVEYLSSTDLYLRLTDKLCWNKNLNIVLEPFCQYWLPFDIRLSIRKQKAGGTSIHICICHLRNGVTWNVLSLLSREPLDVQTTEKAWGYRLTLYESSLTGT
jgi:hypothetical protein